MSERAPGQKPTLCLDFDGVLHSYASGWKGADIVSDPPVEGAIAFLFEALPQFQIAVFSSRSASAEGIAAMRDALTDWIFDAGWPAAIAKMLCQGWPDERGVWNESVIGFPTTKPPAHVTIDDRAICFKGVFPTLRALQGFTPWNKREARSLPQTRHEANIDAQILSD